MYIAIKHWLITGNTFASSETLRLHVYSIFTCPLFSRLLVLGVDGCVLRSRARKEGQITKKGNIQRVYTLTMFHW